MLHARCQTIKLPLISPHTLRHITNTVLDDLGTPINVRMDALGQDSETVNERYTHVNRQRVQTAFAALDDALGVA